MGISFLRVRSRRQLQSILHRAPSKSGGPVIISTLLLPTCFFFPLVYNFLGIIQLFRLLLNFNCNNIWTNKVMYYWYFFLQNFFTFYMNIFSNFLFTSHILNHYDTYFYKKNSENSSPNRFLIFKSLLEVFFIFVRDVNLEWPVKIYLI